MPVQNRIVKVQKRNRALVKFDEGRIRGAILRAAQSIGGFGQDFYSSINDHIFDSFFTDEKIADCLSDAVVVCLNSDPQHHIANFPPTIETIQDEVLHASAVTASRTPRMPTRVIAGGGIGWVKARSRRILLS